MSAKTNLRDWAQRNVPDAQRPTLYKLVAAFVAEAVREDRRERGGGTLTEQFEELFGHLKRR